MIARYGPCWGLTLWRWGRRKVELWYAPADYATPEHTHEDSDSEFLILWARNRVIYRVVNCMIESYVAHTPGVWGKWLSVRAGTPHAFKTGTSCLIWISSQTWKPGVTVTSVAEDFKIT